MLVGRLHAAPPAGWGNATKAPDRPSIATYNSDHCHCSCSLSLASPRSAMRAATFSLACRRALSPSATGWTRAAAAPGARRRPAKSLTAAAAAEQSGSGAVSPTPTPKQQHAALQADYFDREIQALQDSITPEVDAKLARIAAAIPGLSAASRVLDAGAGEGALIPHLQVCLMSRFKCSSNASDMHPTASVVAGKCIASTKWQDGSRTAFPVVDTSLCPAGLPAPLLRAHCLPNPLSSTPSAGARGARHPGSGRLPSHDCGPAAACGCSQHPRKRCMRAHMAGRCHRAAFLPGKGAASSSGPVWVGFCRAKLCACDAHALLPAGQPALVPLRCSDP